MVRLASYGHLVINMQTATAWLVLDEKSGSNIVVNGMTPAEAAMLKATFGTPIQGTGDSTNPLSHVKFNGEIERSGAQEYQRLFQKYGKTKVEKSFPGGNPSLPSRFEDVGIVETEQPSPPQGKIHAQYPPLDNIPRGDDGTDHGILVAQGIAKAKADEQASEIAELKAQLAELKQLLMTPTIVVPAIHDAAPTKDKDPE